MEEFGLVLIVKVALPFLSAFTNYKKNVRNKGLALKIVGAIAQPYLS